MNAASTPHPTLWRTCRAIANRTRLKMFGLLVRQSDQSVSAVAKALNQPLSLTSEYLRVLEARGLLTVRRTGRSVKYRIPSRANSGPLTGLIVALRQTFRNSDAVNIIFRHATAFTHPRRIDIYRALKAKPRDLSALHIATHIPVWAVVRHLSKLERRGFVVCDEGLYSAVTPSNAIGRELAHLATR